MPKFVDVLRPEMDGVKQTLLAREGGYVVDLEMLLDGDGEWVDMTCEHEGEQLLMRLYPDPRQVALGSPQIRLLNVQGELLGQDGWPQEPVQMVEALVAFWTDVTNPLQPCGWVQLWRLPRRPVQEEGEKVHGRHRGHLKRGRCQGARAVRSSS